MVSMLVSLPDDLASWLEILAEATGQAKNLLAVQAIGEFMDQRDWRMAEIKKGLAETEAGDFATDAQMRGLDAKWEFHAD